MKSIKMFFRDEQETSVDVAEAWEVRWTSRYGEYSGNTQPEIRVFTSKGDAMAFRDALVDAFKLIKHTSGCHVSIGVQSV